MLLVINGGTIDKMPITLSDGTFDNSSKVFTKTHIPEILIKVGFNDKYSMLPLFLIDSLDMTDKHRVKIVDALQSTNEKRIIITHGTDSMPDTARFLKRNIRLKGRTIVLTGAIVPYSMGSSSDAIPNIKNAISYAQSLPPGIYVSMNNRIFDADNVRKDVEAGVFKELK